MRVNIQTIHKQWVVFRPVGVSTIFEYIICEFTDSVEVLAAIVGIGSFAGKADGKLVKDECAKHGPVYKSNSHILISCI